MTRLQLAFLIWVSLSMAFSSGWITANRVRDDREHSDRK